tara:strand:- start:710 stop:1066 length:357 start_codon:yes stop_codon:yes gene_type:complete
MSDDDFYKIEFAKNEKLNEFLKELNLKEGNMYIILKPEDEGFEIVGADLLPSDLDTYTGTQMYILFAGLMQMATAEQVTVMEKGNKMIMDELERKREREIEERGDNVIAFKPNKNDIN